MIDELQETLSRHAGRVVPAPDPYARLLRRRARRRARRTGLAAALVLLLVVPAVWWARRPAADAMPGLPPGPVAALLASPTRGSLAGDEGFLRALRERAAKEDRLRAQRPDGTGMPDDPAGIRVLFAGDIGGARVGVVAGPGDQPMRADYLGGVGDDAGELQLVNTGLLDPVVELPLSVYIETPPELVIGPPGSVIEVAPLRYLAAGEQREWAATGGGEGYQLLDRPDQARLVRVSFDGAVLEVFRTGQAPRPTGMTVDPRPLFGRGGAVPPVAVRQIMEALVAGAGVSVPEVRFVVLWSDELPMPGTVSGRVYIATVQAVTKDGGGPYMTLSFDTGAPTASARDSMTGSGIEGAPEEALIVMRLPGYSPEPEERVQLIGPPSAVRADVVRQGQTTSVTLVNGLGQLRMPPDSPATVTFVGADGTAIGSRTFTDSVTTGCDRYIPDICPAR